MSELGGGIALQENWDFEIDNTGDIRANTGTAELQKDVAFNVARLAQREIGSPVTNETPKDLRTIVRDITAADPRINTVPSVTVNRVERGTERFEISASMNTSDGPFDLVFEVEL